jgi:purine-nucleoside phosphorylase
MSTVPEVLAAREEGLNVMVLSLVTNFVVIPESYRSIKEEVAAEVGVAHVSDWLLLTLVLIQLAGKKFDLPPPQTVSHEEVLAIGKEKAGVLMKLVENVVDSLQSAWHFSDYIYLTF